MESSRLSLFLKNIFGDNAPSVPYHGKNNLPEAMKYFKVSADLGDSRGIYNYGFSLQEGYNGRFSLIEEHFTKEKGYQFNADIIYGDTDSIMVDFGNVTVQEAIKLGQDAANFVSRFFPPPIHLEFEKAYHPYLLISMKRYSGLLWTNSSKPDRIDTKGIETVKRDNCKLVQHLIQISLNKLMYNQEFKSSVRMIETFISELLQDRIDLSLLIISKSLSKDDYKTQAPHTMLAKKLGKRDSGSVPRVGDRIPYVIVEGNKSSKIYERGEDSMFILQNRLQIDSHYYLENQLKKPIMRIFKSIIGEEEAAKIFQ
jgi:DNA polymerase delta subunit 1